MQNKKAPGPHGYRPDIDGLRALAVLAVVVYHAFPQWLPGGFTGVDVFFVISGYLITGIVLGELALDRFSLTDFYARRVRRIFPPLLLVLVACWASGWFVLLPDEYSHLGRYVQGGAAFVANFTAMKEAGYFDSAIEMKPLLHLWSLAVEEQFYLVWPLLLWFAARRRMALVVAIAVLGACSFAVALVADQEGSARYFSTQARGWQLLCGALLAMVAGQPAPSWARAIGVRLPTFAKARANVAATVGLALVAAGVISLNKVSAVPAPGGLLPVVGTSLMIYAGSRAWVNRRILSHAWLVALGLASYSLYLWHWPLLSLLHIAEGREPSAWIRAAAVGVAVLLAAGTYQFVELPLRRHHRPRAAALVLLPAMAIVCTVGWLTARYDGFEFRKQALHDALGDLKTPRVVDDIYCRAAHPYARSGCYDSPNRHAATLFMVGDSHMDALAVGFRRMAEADELPFNLTTIGQGGCGPLLDVEAYWPGTGASQHCRDIVTPALQEALARADVRWVMLVGRHALWTEGTGFGNAERTWIENRWRHSYADEEGTSAQAFERGLNRTLDELERAGKRVVFVHQVPEFGFQPRSCLTGFRQFTPKPCDISRAEVEFRQKSYRDVVSRVLATRPAVIEFDPLPRFCDSVRCSPFDADGKPLYLDDDHLNWRGAEAVARELMGRIGNLGTR
ncbi:MULTISPECIES: acyltransferase family protein [Ramlibacter]|uniref:acyltransferase family protein n=1 Tax=Ramlibacter TaxID=174951 RepID=UPI0012FB73ED|nr:MULTISPECIES: acyltransferase family protein [Ramlibacter]MBA2965411.1 acyltransferase [Ramlibacter sp. CGMCC 1.13660]